MLKTIQFIVSGRVQGVGFRYSAQRKALALGISGWVRNCADGDVEGIAQGDDDQLNEFEKWLAVGPKYAAVSRVNSSVIRRERISNFQITQ